VKSSRKRSKKKKSRGETKGGWNSSCRKSDWKCPKKQYKEKKRKKLKRKALQKKRGADHRKGTAQKGGSGGVQFYAEGRQRSGSKKRSRKKGNCQSGISKNQAEMAEKGRVVRTMAARGGK